jgi:hypothetical protein
LTPGHPWLLEAYASVAPHPFASVIGQEIFQTGIIPGKLTGSLIDIYDSLRWKTVDIKGIMFFGFQESLS